MNATMNIHIKMQLKEPPFEQIFLYLQMRPQLYTYYFAS